MKKNILLLTAAALALGTGLSATAGPAPAAHENAALALKRALADPQRASDRPADSRRKPEALVALAEVRPGDKVLDLIPGTGYWTRIFSRIVGPRGHVYAVWPQAYAKLATGDVAALQAMSRSPSYGNVTTIVEPTTQLTAPEKLDVVWTSQNYHDYPDGFMGHTPPAALNKAVFDLLKPGGIYVVIDHAAKPGAGMRATETLHRIDPRTVKAQVVAAGFVFAGESRVLVNARDPLTIKVFDPSVRGRTSQFAFKFRKPR
ncbi:MAG: hypothetical protein JWO81_2003 [Alphaproteobacteria bacterium]|nr:hypothetical protein [Alphaproteobacteria bacterium]